jgi:cell division protein FtsZ
MGNAGTALMGIGKGSGRDRATEAATAAINSPLLDFSIDKARGVVFNIVGGTDMTLQEINAAAEVIYTAVDPNANIIFGAIVDDSMNGDITITVIATGFPNEDPAAGVTSTAPRTVGEAKRRMASSAAPVKKEAREREKEERADRADDVPDFLSRLRRKK